MDPYEYTSNGNDNVPADENLADDEIARLEEELTPKGADYYGILNISRSASEGDIKDAYKKLCRFFHPDKHNTDETKKIAESRFQVIQRAYEVLTDAQKRAIYDTYGEAGLTAKWEVGPKFKSTDEMMAEFEKKERLRREKELESLVRAHNDFTLRLDATQILDPYDPPVFTFGQPTQVRKKHPLEFLTRGRVEQLFMRHSFETQIGPQTQAIIGGSMVTQGGMGGGNLVGTIRHTVSPKLWGEFSATILHPRIFTLKTNYNVSADSFVNATFVSRTLSGPPVTSVTAGRRLFKSTTGYITYRTGEWALGSWGDSSRASDKSSVSLGLASAHKQGSYSVELQTGIQASHLAGDYTHKLPNHMVLRLSSSLSSSAGIAVSIGSDHKVSEHIRFGMVLECGLASGVMIKFRASRLGQKFSVPIILSQGLDLRVALGALIVPSSVALALDRYVLTPRRKLRIKEKIAALREEHQEYLATRKQEALDAQLLMADIGQRKRNQEEKKEDGLVIEEAVYGNLNGQDEDEKVDVTLVVQTLVNESRLTIPGGHSKTSILGFYDPCLGEHKQLKVRYRFRHRLHEAIVEDTAHLICPMQSHLI
ncbi:hypothetical protein F4703DRAFT_1831829 [Phycomyces blakesleeanus]